MRSLDERIKSAISASPEELRILIREPHPAVMSNALLNRNLTEDMAVYIARAKAASPETLAFLAGDVRFKESYKLKAAICRNPKTPQRIHLSLLKFMRVFDLADIANDQRISIAIRQKIEYIICERMPSLPSGVKTALARKAHPDVLLRLMESIDEKVIAACLDSPRLTEGYVCRAINRPQAGAVIVRLISEHAKWALRYPVKIALVRNFYTPVIIVIDFISGMKSSDLRELYWDSKTPTSSKPFLFNELASRGVGTGPGEHEKYELDGDEDSDMNDAIF